MNTPDQPTDSPGRQMFGQFIQQESASTDDRPSRVPSASTCTPCMWARVFTTMSWGTGS